MGTHHPSCASTTMFRRHLARPTALNPLDSCPAPEAISAFRDNNIETHKLVSPSRQSGTHAGTHCIYVHAGSGIAQTRQHPRHGRAIRSIWFALTRTEPRRGTKPPSPTTNNRFTSHARGRSTPVLRRPRCRKKKQSKLSPPFIQSVEAL